jgi:hexokinase
LTTESRIRTEIQKAKQQSNYRGDKSKLPSYEGYRAKTIIPDIMLSMNCDKDENNVLGFDYGKHRDSYLFDVSFMHTAQSSRTKQLLNNLNAVDYETPFMEALRSRDDEKNRKYIQTLGEAVKSRFMPIIFDVAGGVGEFNSSLLESRCKDYHMIRDHLVDESEYEKHKKWFLKLNAINVAKNNYDIFREYMMNNRANY